LRAIDAGAEPQAAILRARLFASECAGCHGTYTPPLMTYDQIFSAQHEVLTEIYSCRMPPFASSLVQPTQNRVDVLTWLVCGAPNN
jgi:hypothetical protein